MTRERALSALSMALCMSLCVAGGFAAGCAGSSRTAGSATVPFDAVVLSVEHNQDALTSLSGEGELRVETASFSQGGDLDILLRKPDTLQITVKGPFGIRVGNALVTRTNFQFYSTMQNRLYTGRTTAENMRKTLRIDLTFDDILALFTGGRFLAGDRTSPDEIGVDGGDAVFTFTGGEYGRRYVVDPSTKLIRRIYLIDNDGAPMIEQAFADFQTVGGVTIPRTITITQHQSRQRFTLRYGQITTNTEHIQFTFSAPGNAERVELK